MKRFLILIVMAAIAAMTMACSKDDLYDSNPQAELQQKREVRTLSTPDSKEPSTKERKDTVIFTCVPAHMAEDGILRDGKGKQEAMKCFCLITENGCKVVVFDKDKVFPTIDEISEAPLIEGDMTAYNSAYYDPEADMWLPAIAADESWGISYSVLSATKDDVPSKTTVRSVLNQTLKNWNWENKSSDDSYSTVLNGYTCCLENGVLKVQFGETKTTLEL
jgi:Ni/Co efflux regulator RcnB